MIKQNLVCKNNFLKQDLNKNFSQKLLKKFNKTIHEINLEIDNDKKLLHVLNKDYKFNFKLNDLRNFKKYNTIAIVGMGGSILGSEAIYNFLAKNIKKKVYFFNNLDFEKISNFKKKNKVIVIGDSEADEKLAKINNIEFALIKNGYAKKNLRKFKKKYLFENFFELSKILLNDF